MAQKCKRCEQIITSEEYVTCYGECKGIFHFECSVNENAYKKLSIAKKKTWRCQNCSQQTSRNTRGSVTQIADGELEAEESEIRSEIKDIKKMFSTIMDKLNDINSIKKEIVDLKENVKFISDQYDTIQSTLKENNLLITNMKKSINILETENSNKNKIIEDMNYKINKLEQHSRRKNVEINEMPLKPNENCSEIVIDIAKTLNMKLEISDIEFAHRIQLRNKDKIPPIIVQFISKQTRDEFLSKKNVTMFKGLSTQAKIYINEHISPAFKSLLMITKQMARETKHKYVWFRKDKILVRKREDSPVIVIECEKDLRKLKISNNLNPDLSNNIGS